MTKDSQEAYPSYVPTTVTRPFDSLGELFLDSVNRYQNRIAFSCLDQELSFFELGEKAKKFASFLQNDCLLEPQDRVAIMLPNVSQYPIVLFGIFLAGGVVVNLNPMDKASAIQHELANSEAKVVIVLENFVHELENILDQTKLERVVLTSMGDVFKSSYKGFWVNFYLRYFKKMVPVWHTPGAIRFREALRLGEQKKYQPIKTSPEDLAFLQFTSGTTGRPKAAMLTHSNMLFNLAQAGAWVGHLFSPQDRVITPLPLYHIFSLLANCLMFVYLGAENCLIPNPRDIPGFIKTLRKKPFVGLTGVNTLFVALMADPNFKKINFTALKLVLGGGMGVIPVVAAQWQKMTGVPICQAYGLTEASPAVCINPVDSPFDGTVGYPISSTEVGIFNDDGKKLSMGEPGELWVRGPQVMKGYFKNDEATRETITPEGWLKTGDIAILNSQGKVKIIDRKKDIIIVSGFNVSPGEVESIISEIPGVQEVGVIGMPDEIHGEQVKACVVLKFGFSVTEAEIKSYCHERLAAYKSPKTVSFYPESLPKSQVGKILHRELRKLELEKSGLNKN